VLGTTTARGHRSTLLHILLHTNARLRCHTRHQKKKHTKKSRIFFPNSWLPGCVYFISVKFPCCHVVVIKVFSVPDDVPV
jgi:hypothetical protein